MATKYNNLSPKLKSMVPTLKVGEKIRFQLNGVYTDPQTKKFICPRSKRLKSLDRIYDPWAITHKIGNKVSYEGAYVDIAYVIREVPAPKDSVRDSLVEFGEIVFLSTSAGVVEITGGQKDQEAKLQFLFLSNENSSNEGKEWFIRPQHKPAYRLLAKKEEAKVILERENMIDKAREAIRLMSPEEVTEAARGLLPTRYNAMSNDERIVALRNIASKDPAKILGVSKDVNVQAIAFIENCIKHRIISIDNTKHQWVWGDDKTKLCSINNNAAPHNALKRYFLTEEGKDSLKQMESMLEIAEKAEKEPETVKT